MLAGCTSESMSSLHLLSLSYTGAGGAVPENAGMVNGNTSAVFADLARNARLEVRASYFGLCAKSPNIASGWICSRSAASIAAVVAEAGNSSAKAVNGGASLADPLNIVYMASKFRTDIVFVGLQ